MSDSEIKRAIGQNLPSADARHDAYRSDRRFWQEASGQAVATLSRSLVTLSTAGIGLTIALITQDFVPTSTFQFAPLLGAWIGFMGAILLVHSAYSYTQRASRAYIDEADAEYNGLEEVRNAAEEERVECDNRQSNLLKYAQWCFYAAILLTLAFVTIQIS